MTRFALAEYAPDQANFDSPALPEALNVMPSDGGYAPFPGFAADEGQIATGPVRGVIEYDFGGIREQFVGTQSKLWRKDAATYEDVSKAGNYDLGDTEFWSMEAFGSYIIAFNGSADPQKFDLAGAGTDFVSLGGSPPGGVAICVHKDFVFTWENHASTGQSSVQWSGIADSEIWDGTSLSDIQPIADGGFGKAIINAGDCVFYFQERKCHRFIYNSNPEVVFTRDEVEVGRGCVGSKACTADGGVVFFLAHDGFYSIAADTTVEPIGAGRVNDTFFRRCAADSVPNTILITDPKYTRIYVVYRSIDAGSAPYDEILTYDWRLKTWAPTTISLQWLFGSSTEPWTLEDLEAVYGTLENVPEPLSSQRWKGGDGLLAMFDPDGYFGALNGANMEATFETSTMLEPISVHKLLGRIMGIINTNQWTAALGTLERTGDTLSWSAPESPNVSGWAKFRVAARGARVRLTVAQGAIWTKAQGVEVQSQPAFAPER